MPNPEAAKMIGGNLHALPHPNPKINEVRLMGYRPFGVSQQPKDVQDKINAHAQSVGEGVVHLLEQNGKTIVDTAELNRLRAAVAVQEPGQKIAHGYCAHCGVELIRLFVDDNMDAKLHRVAQEAMGLKHGDSKPCWSR
jgi:hypothetical protein